MSKFKDSPVLISLLSACGLILLVAVWPFGSEPTSERQAAATDTKCSPGFPYQGQWRGGDVATSIALDEKRSLWLFGDTFIQPVQSQANRTGAKMIHNSIGLSACDENGRWEMEYFWSKSLWRGIRSFFHKRDEAGEYWWPMSAFKSDEAVFVLLIRVRPGPPRGDLNLPFVFTGVDMAKITHFERSPSRWKIEYSPVVKNADDFPVSGTAVKDGYVYIYSFKELAGTNLVNHLYRMRLAGLGTSPMQTLTKSGFADGFLPDQAISIFADGSERISEVSVQYLDKLQSWVALYSYPDIGQKRDVGLRVRFAKDPAGPWSDYKTVYHFPELTADYSGGYVPYTFCYAGKMHTQLNSDSGILATYVCNLYTPEGMDPYKILAELFQRMDFYRPQVVRIPTQKLIDAKNGK